MKKLIHVTLIFALLLETSACSTSKALIDYNGFDSTVQIHTDAVSGTALGPVKGDEGGAIWTDCTDKASESLRYLIAEAKNKGANAVGDLKWYATHNSTPSCKKGWGYLVIWPFILTPLFMSTEVEGVAYKLDHASKTSGMYMLPNSEQEEAALIRQILAKN